MLFNLIKMHLYFQSVKEEVEFNILLMRVVFLIDLTVINKGCVNRMVHFIADTTY